MESVKIVIKANNEKRYYWMVYFDGNPNPVLTSPRTYELKKTARLRAKKFGKRFVQGGKVLEIK